MSRIISKEAITEKKMRREEIMETSEKTKQNARHYLICESRSIYLLLMLSAGMMGAYTFNMRGGVFCNAQTANFVIMAVTLGKGDIKGGLYYLIPVTAYFLGAFISEAIPTPVKRLGFLRWDTCLIAIEAIVLFIVGLVPLSVPHHVVQVTINFIASMQYNTFRQAEGVPMATTFCTNHLRQVGIACAKAIRKKDHEAFARGMIHAGMILSFVAGAVIVTMAGGVLMEKSIWLALIPTLIILCRLIYADLYKEHDLLMEKPAGH